jgi:hypothetical protein
MAQILVDGLWISGRIRTGVKLQFSRPGKPTDNAMIETFNAKVRVECLDQHWFESLEEAKQQLEAWRREYNEERPHSSLGDLTPTEFAAVAAATAVEKGRSLTFHLVYFSGGDQRRSLAKTMQRCVATASNASSTVGRGDGANSLTSSRFGDGEPPAVQPNNTLSTLVAAPKYFEAAIKA